MKSALFHSGLWIDYCCSLFFLPPSPAKKHGRMLPSKIFNLWNQDQFVWYRSVVTNVILKSYILLQGTGVGAGCCKSGFPPFCSDDGAVGRISSLGSTIDTWSGNGFFGPVFPVGSHGSMILTLIPKTPTNNDFQQILF